MIALGTPVPQECVLKAYTTCHCTQYRTLMEEVIWKNQFYSGISICGKFSLEVFISLFPIWTTF